jgi:hypothetical protein
MLLIPARLRLITAITVSALAVLALGGCNGPGTLSSGQRYSIAVDTYDISVRAMVAASRSGVLEADDYRAWDRDIRKPVSAGLDAWAAAIVKKQPYTELDALNALLDEMVSARVVVERKASNAPSSGSTGNRTSRRGGVARHLLRRRGRAIRRAGPDPGGVRRPYLQKGVRRRPRGCGVEAAS